MATELQITGISSEEGPLVQVQILPSIGERAPADICCVVDVSGSMSKEAVVQNGDGESEQHGLSILDLVKHSILTVIQMLQPQDTLSLVSYSNDANVVLPRLEMTDVGKQQAASMLETLTARGATNMWGGIHTALELMRQIEPATDGAPKVKSVLLLTDGVPSPQFEPDIFGALTRYRKRYPKACECEVSTFGFGYSLDSSLLANIAQASAGYYAFIPDGGFVGTTFIHAMANTLCQVGQPSFLTLTAKNGAALVHDDNTETHRVELRSLQQGQPRNFTLRVNVPEVPADVCVVEAALVVGSAGDPSSAEMCGQLSASSSSFRRIRFIETVLEALQQVETGGAAGLQAAQAQLGALREELVQAGAKASDPILQDLNGQVSEAFSRKDWFDRWGRHYLRSLLMAHELERCTNFKDPGLQQYAQGELFNSLRDEADDLFMNLPPPQPSVVRVAAQSAAVAPPRAPVDMSSYHNCNNSCFRGDGQVSMFDGSKQAVDAVQAGDIVLSCGKAATVRCVLKTLCDAGRAEMVTLTSGLVLTPYHPIKQQGLWCFPLDVEKPVEVQCDAVYSFVLDRGHTLEISGIECVCLGHGIHGDVVASHSFFGTNQVVDALAALPGWTDGQITFQHGSTKRNSITNLVDGFVAERQIR